MADTLEIARAKELVEKIGAILGDGEFVLVLTKEINGFIILPDETTLRARLEGLTPFDSVGPVMLAHQLLTVALSAHSHVLAKNDKDGQKVLQSVPRIVKPS